MWSLVLLAVVLVVVLPPDQRFTVPPPWLLAAQAGGGVACGVVLRLFGYRTPAIHVEERREVAAAAAVRAMQGGTILRFAIAEPIALGSLAAVFVVDGGSLTWYLSGAAVSLALIGFHAWPRARAVDRTVASLERAGGRSHLRETLGLPPRPSGAVQEL